MGLSIDMEEVIRGLEKCKRHECDDCAEKGASQAPWDCPAYDDFVDSAIALLKEQEVVKSKIIPEELKQKMWNALYAEEDKFEKKYVGTKEHNSWFLIYRPWLQEGFNLAIKAIADWEGR